MDMLIGFFVDRLVLTVVLLILLLPFAILLSRKLIHFFKLLGFYPKIKCHPPWGRNDLRTEEIPAYLQETARSQQIKARSHSKRIDYLHWHIYIDLQALRRRLSIAPAEIISLVPASQWFFDNYNFFYKELMKLQAFGNLRKFHRMPVLTGEYGFGYPRIYMMAREMISCGNYRLKESSVLEMLKQYQAVAPISARELWALPEMLILCLLEKITDESRQVIQIIETKRFAEKTVNRLANRLNQDEKSIVAALRKECGLTCLQDSIFISHLLYRLKGMSVSESDIANWLAAALKEDPVSYREQLPDMIEKEEQFEAAAEANISSLVASLKVISDINWDEELLRVCSMDLILAEDPSGIYASMDSHSRGLYRFTVERLARRYRLDENDVARKALEIAKSPPPDSNFAVPGHVGTYLAGPGQASLKARLSGRQMPTGQGRWVLKRHEVIFYYAGIALLTIGFVTSALLLAASETQLNPWLLIPLGILLLIPAVSIGMFLMQHTFSRLFKPKAQLAMDFHEQIPEEYRTIVVMPVIFGSASQVRSYTSRLEKHYLANRQNNIYFALLGDFKDAMTETTPDDADLIELAENEIHNLNLKYPGMYSRFSLFYRPRRWNPAENCWMGWERKRGKLEEFNALLSGDTDTDYIIKVGDKVLLNEFKYVITLDADTELIRGSAAALIGIMAHPLNHPVIDLEHRKVLDGYVIVQPEVRNRVAGPFASVFTRFFTGQTGIDPYATVVSDVYQDVFREGIFVGKGIYDVQAMHSLLRGTIPENRILSHDLLEGSLSRCAFASGVKLMDTPPAGIISYVRREHRWIRGDWQLLPWLLQRSPINLLSRWKIFDNLRRSLIQPAYLALILFCGYFLQQYAWIWIPFICFDSIFNILNILVRIVIQKNRNPSLRLAISATWGNLAGMGLQLLIILMLIPYRAFQAIDAIARTLYRLLISRRNLLEWQTAEAIERGLKNTTAYHFRAMWPVVLPAVLLGLEIFINPVFPNFLFMAIIALLWLLSPLLSWMASRQARQGLTKRIKPEQIRRLRLTARRTWNYFEDFSTAENHWLCPDNYQKSPGPKASDKTSPTNIGLQLLATLSARDMGYLGLQAMLEKCEQILSTVQELPKWHGHLYNWYQIRTLHILDPQYVSTVDSGNFIAHLIALKNGLAAIRNEPVFSRVSLTGLNDSLVAAGLDPLKNQKDCQTTGDWANMLQTLQDSLSGTPTDDRWRKRIRTLCQGFLADIAITGTDAVWQKQPTLLALANDAGNENCILAVSLLARFDELITQIDRLVREADFRPLYDASHRLFLIGYHVASQTPDPGRYDLMASEARLTSFLAIAKGDVPQKHWFALGRPFTMIRGTPTLLSWSGSMFEYLMPNLVLKTPPGCIFDQSCKAAVIRQIAHGRKQKIPWGVSESQFYAFDVNSNYQYTAFGVMRLRLQSSLRPVRVIAPYATMLALLTKPQEALKNIERLRNTGAEGEYGFYEALDYNRPDSTNLRPFSLVQSLMTHHLGMSFVAINNLLHANIMQTRFHQEPMVKATDILLEEKSAIGLVSVSRRWYTINLNRVEKPEDAPESRYFLDVNPPEPAAHVLANKHYMLMLTSDGDGFSSCDNIMLNRWRPDVSGGSYGSFIYIRNLDSGQVWSSAYRPVRKEPDDYQAIFSPDKAEFIRKDGNIGTRTEITLSPMENLELRRITFTNHGEKTVRLDVTSYMEVVIDQFQAETAHPAFNKLFIETEYIGSHHLLIARKRLRSPDDHPRAVMHMIRSETGLKQPVEYEIDRRLFIGRNGTMAQPQVLASKVPLSCRDGYSTDPILSLRTALTIPAGHSSTLAFITGFGDSREELLQMADNYDKIHDDDDIFKLSLSSSKLRMKYLSIKPSQLNAIQNLVGGIYYPTLTCRGPAEAIERNRLGQSGLWRSGISGDHPIILLKVAELRSANLINDVLLAFEFLRLCHVQVDLVIYNDENTGYAMELNHLIQNLVSRLKIFSEGLAKPSLFVVNRFQLSQEESDLLLTTARLVVTPKTGIFFRQKLPKAGKAERKTAAMAGRSVIRLPAGTEGEPIPGIPNVSLLDGLEKKLEFFNGMGGFAQNGREYMILIRNGMRTPSPWINIIANEQFGFQVSESGAGYTWSGNSRENKLTAWSNDPVLDPVSEAVYVRDETSGAITSPCLLVPGFGGDYKIRHGFGYSVFEHEELDLEQSLNLFTAADAPVRLWQLSLTNKGPDSKEYTVTLYVEWLIGVTRDQSAPYVITAYDPKAACLYAWNNYSDLSRDRIAFLFASEKIVSFSGNRQEFLGTSGSSRYPQGLTLPRLSGTVGAGLDPCGVIQIKLRLAPGENRTVIFGLGQTESREKAIELASRFRTPAAASEALAAVNRFWEKSLGSVQIRTPDRSLDILFNGWLQYQVLACRLMARAAFYQCGGAFGFRDQLQDVLAFLDSDPARVRQQILLACSRQFTEGDVQHWWHPPTGVGVRTRISDDLLWLPYVTAEYIQGTGDLSLLEEKVPYLEGSELAAGQHEIMFTPVISGRQDTVYQHCLLAIEHACQFGSNGLPLMGGGDWNDGMNAVGINGTGESVWLGWFLFTVLHRFAPICRSLDDLASQRRLTSIAANLTGNLETKAWDGQWYLRAFFDNGNPMGSKSNEECKIDLISQCWAVLSGAADRKRSTQALESARKYLVREDTRSILLLDPPFDHSADNPGYIRGYYPGVRENGGQYTHGAIWLAIAFAKLKDESATRDLINLLNPIGSTMDLKGVYRYEKEPYVMAGDIGMAAPYQGRAGWSWYTGAAGWMYQAILRHYLGFTRQGDELYLEPCVPVTFRNFQVKYRFGKSSYIMDFLRGSGATGSIKTIEVDRNLIVANHFTLVDDGAEHMVTVRLSDKHHD